MLINTYKEDTKIISDFYKYKDSKGDIINLDGIINPLKIDNRQLMSPTDNQRNFSACAGFSAATYIESLLWKQTGKLKQLDSLQVYQLAKQIDGDINADGTYLECSMKAVMKLCEGIKEFDFLKDMKIETFFNGGDQNTIEYVKFLLHKYDFFQIGFQIDEGLYDCNQNNYILKPRGNIMGGHAVNICGYGIEGFYILNQWGNWGAKGYAIIPYDLFLKQFMYCAWLTEKV